MSLSDPIADMLTRIRNAHMVGHPQASMPASKVKAAIAEILRREGYVTEVKHEGKGPTRELVVCLKYYQNKPVISGLKRVSKPSCRNYVKARDIPRVRGGMGVAILSTPVGILSGREARAQNVGGEVLCYVW